ncbi:glycosyltransferase family 2 protein [Enterococcus sp. HY326]|uniref:glycosyltransferase family 2 protein n=1 Tax=Enterococcus sp. HY326 TaxID=2971265 RepID=UPI0022401E70|nr:glycosyltransferase family 2 protein [Enterococcus sp. HY326]
MLSMLTIVVPCYNEEEVLPVSSQALLLVIKQLIEEKQIHPESKLLFVDDGSKDDTWQVITELHKTDPVHFNGLKLSRNFGHQKALLAGMTQASASSDIVISIDADLQDDVQAIRNMVAAYHEGYDVVYGVRNNRESDTFFKRHSAQLFYGLMKKMGVELIPNHADFRLLSHRAVTNLLAFSEEAPFFRGLVPLVGFSSTNVYYRREKRVAGESKYPLKKMIRFALEGITSFSILPIQLIRLLGLVTILIGIFYMGYTLVQKYIYHAVVNGWASIIMSIWVLGGLQLVGIATIGEYLGRVYTEVKKRPRFIIETVLEKKERLNESDNK